jgi:hypothetical protein
MIRKFYDIDFCVGSSGNYVVDTKSTEASTIIECECGSHILKIQMDADIYTLKDRSQTIHQTYYLAMFSFGVDKNNFWSRLKISFKYLRTGKMFDDQLSLEPTEALKMSNFITSSLIETDCVATAKNIA